MSAKVFQETQMQNGIQVVSEYIDSVYSVALGVCIAAGSINETEQTNGIAHMFEHMAFKRTAHRNAFQIAHEIESLGGMVNATTGKNFTCYYTRLMSEHVGKGVEVLADIVQNTKIDPVEFEREKNVVIEEIKNVEDTPSDIIHDYLSEQLFPQHPLGRSIQGTIDSIRNLTIKQVYDFVHQNYTTDRIFIVAAGRIRHTELMDLVTRFFDQRNISQQSMEIPSIPNKIVPCKTYNRKIQQAHLVLGRRLFPHSDKRRFHLSLLNVILSGGMTSRLFQNIREKYGFVYTTFSFAEFYLNSGIFGLYGATDQRTLKQTRKLIYEELKKLARQHINSEELKKAKQQFKGAATLGLESMQARMNRLARLKILEKRLMTIDELLEIIDSITARDLIHLADYLYDPQAFAETNIIPQSPSEVI